MNSVKRLIVDWMCVLNAVVGRERLNAAGEGGGLVAGVQEGAWIPDGWCVKHLGLTNLCMKSG